MRGKGIIEILVEKSAYAPAAHSTRGFYNALGRLSFRTVSTLVRSTSTGLDEEVLVQPFARLNDERVFTFLSIARRSEICTCVQSHFGS